MEEPSSSGKPQFFTEECKQTFPEKSWFLKRDYHFRMEVVYMYFVLPLFENGNPRASHLKCIPLVKNWLRSKRLYEVLWFEKLILFVRIRPLLPSEFSILDKKNQTKKWSSVKIQRKKWWKYCLQVNFMWKSSSTLFTFGEYKWNKVK